MERLLVAAFAEAGDRAAGPVPADDLRRGMARYGSDRPDLRYGMEIQDWTRAGAAGPGSRVFERMVEAGGVVRGLVVPGAGAGITARTATRWSAEARSSARRGWCGPR